MSYFLSKYIHRKKWGTQRFVIRCVSTTMFLYSMIHIHLYNLSVRLSFYPIGYSQFLSVRIQGDGKSCGITLQLTEYRKGLMHRGNPQGSAVWCSWNVFSEVVETRTLVLAPSDRTQWWWKSHPHCLRERSPLSEKKRRQDDNSPMSELKISQRIFTRKGSGRR